MTSFYLYLLAYLVLSFALGAVWHVVLFKEYYKKLAIYSNIENPRFSFGLSAMFIQGIVFAYRVGLLCLFAIWSRQDTQNTLWKLCLLFLGIANLLYALRFFGWMVRIA